MHPQLYYWSLLPLSSRYGIVLKLCDPLDLHSAGTFDHQYQDRTGIYRENGIHRFWFKCKLCNFKLVIIFFTHITSYYRLLTCLLELTYLLIGRNNEQEIHSRQVQSPSKFLVTICYNSSTQDGSPKRTRATFYSILPHRDKFPSEFDNHLFFLVCS